MKWKVIIINVLILILLDFLFGTMYALLKNHNPSREIKEKSEQSFRRRDADFHHGLRPGFDGHTYWHKRYRISTDNLGFKGSPGKQTKIQKNSGRTVFIGDSFTEGIGVEHPFTFAGLFERTYPEHEIINMGVASYSPILYKDKLRHFILRGFEYDNLVLCLDISDIQDEIVYTGRRFLVDPRERRPYRIVHWLVNHSLFISIAKATFGRTGWYLKIIGDERQYIDERSGWVDSDSAYRSWARMGLELAAANVDTIADLHRTSGHRMFLVVYPWPAQISKGKFRNRHTIFWEEYCRREGIIFINLFEAFERECARMGRSRMLTDNFIDRDVHWNEQGHAFVFDALDSLLGPYLSADSVYFPVR
jgi:hypothetical protein